MRSLTGKPLIITILLLGSVMPGLSQEEQLVINLQPTVNKQLFVFENPKGSIKVTGYEGEDIVVNASLRFPESLISGSGRIRRTEQNPFDITAETTGSNVVLFCKSSGKTVDFDIKIPLNFNLRLKSLDNGIIQIVNITGEIEVENPNGDILLENISGCSVLSSVYGKISASFREIKPDSPMMFTSFEGDILLNLPASVRAILKMKSGTGEITTDIDMIFLKQQPVEKNVENTRIYSLEDWIVGKVNGGGPEFIIRSYNGNIMIKKMGN